MTTNAGHPITAEELFQYPDHDRYELVAGNLRVSEPPGGAHGQVAMRLGYRSKSCRPRIDQPRWRTKSQTISMPVPSWYGWLMPRSGR